MKSTTPATSTRSGSSSAAAGLQLVPATAATRTYLALANRLSWVNLVRQALPASGAVAARTTGLEPVSSTGAAGDLEQVISAIGQSQISCYSATAKVAKIEMKLSTYKFKTETCCSLMSDMRR